MAEIRGEQKEIGWGSQIRSYVFHPYSMVKDHRTNTEVGNVNAVMDGDIDDLLMRTFAQKFHKHVKLIHFLKKASKTILN